MSVATGRTVAAGGPVATVATGLRRGNPKGQHHQSHKAQNSFRDRFHDNSPDRSFQFKPFVLTAPTRLAPSENASDGLGFRSEEPECEGRVPPNWGACLRSRKASGDSKPEVRGRLG